MEQRLLVAGIALILIGFFLVFAGSLAGNTDAETGGAVFIGPIPIIFGSDRKMELIAAVVGAAVLGFLLLFRS